MERNNRNITLAVTLRGRTGNVLFQVGSAVAIAARYNLNLCIDRMSPTYNIFLEMEPLLNIIPKTCSNYIQKLLKYGNKINLYNRCLAFDDDFYLTHGNFSRQKSLLRGKLIGLDKLFCQHHQDKLSHLFDLRGWRQSWKYLKIGPRVKQLRLKNKVILDARKKLERLGHIHKRVAIHLRVTDASLGPGRNFPGQQYFKKAMHHFREKWENVTFLVFSDNPWWCSQQSLFIGKDVKVKERGSKDLTAEKNNDFALMSASDGFIHTIGSFGWWAGYFCFQNGGEVIYFKNYFKKSINATELMDCQQKKVEDYFPPQWIGLSAPPLENIINGKKIELKGDVLAGPPFLH